MKPILLWLSVAIGLALFIPVLWTTNWSDAASTLQNSNPEYITLYLAATAIIISLLVLRWQIIVIASGVDVSYYRLFSYQLSRTAVSFVTPGPRVGGDAVAAGLLTRHQTGRKRTTFSHALSTVVLDRAVEVQTFSVLFFLGVFWLSFHGELPASASVPLLIISSICLFFAAVVAIGFAKGKHVITTLMKRFSKNKKTIAAAKRFENETMAFYRARPRAFLLATLVSALAWLVSLVEYSAALQVLGFNAPLWGVFIVYSFVGLAYLLPIPLALGTLETSQTTAFTIIGFNPVGGLLLALLIRARDIIISLVGFIILASHGFTRK